MSLLDKIFKTNIEEPEEENNYYKIGADFEKYCLGLFPPKYFDVEHYTTGNAELGRYVRDCINPDIRLVSKDTNESFWIECKYRSNLEYNESLYFADKQKIERYKKIETESKIPVFIMAGVGNKPTNPERIYLFDLKRFPYEHIFSKILTQAEIQQNYFRSLKDIENHINHIKK